MRASLSGLPTTRELLAAHRRARGKHNVYGTYSISAIKRDDPEGALTLKYDLTKFRTLFLAGERSDPDTLIWAERYLGVPVIDLGGDPRDRLGNRSQLCWLVRCRSNMDQQQRPYRAGI